MREVDLESDLQLGKKTNMNLALNALIWTPVRQANLESVAAAHCSAQSDSSRVYLRLYPCLVKHNGSFALREPRNMRF